MKLIPPLRATVKHVFIVISKLPRLQVLAIQLTDFKITDNFNIINSFLYYAVNAKSNLNYRKFNKYGIPISFIFPASLIFYIGCKILKYISACCSKCRTL
jgi:hypothetical protein